MVQYLRSYHQGISEPQRKSRVNRKLIWLTSKIQCNLFLCRGRRECIMSIFLQPCYRGLQHFSLPEYSENSGKCISITLSTHVESVVLMQYCGKEKKKQDLTTRCCAPRAKIRPKIGQFLPDLFAQFYRCIGLKKWFWECQTSISPKR